MPHIIVEHTQDVEGVQSLLSALHSSLAEQDTVVLSSLKTRSIPVTHAIVGDGSSNSMVHITLKLLPGRSDALLEKMTNDLKKIAEKHCSSATCITVESMNLNEISYKK